MYNPEVIYFGENGFSSGESYEPDLLTDEEVAMEFGEELIFGEEEFDVEALEEQEGEFAEEDSLDDDEGFEESDLSFFDDDTALSQLVNEINRDVSRMNESEATEYMEDRMAEFWPALAAALPAIVQLAPTAINAVTSLVKKEPSKPKQAPAPQVPKPVPSQANTPAPVTNTVQGTPIPLPDGIPPEVLKVLTDLIQSPKLLEMLTGMLAGKSSGVTTNTGQQINGSNVLGVISSLAGAIAGGTPKESSESYFPEYTMSEEGTFLIDPHNALQEGQLILEMIN